MNKPLIYEPMTAITDLMIFGLGLYFALEVYGLYSTRLMNVHFYFALVFLFTGLSALFGAVIHGVGPHIDRGFNLILWKLTIYSIGLATFFIIMVGLNHVLKYHTLSWYKWILFIVLLFYFVVITKNDNFKNVIIFYMSGMFLVFLMMLYSRFVYQEIGTGWIVAGILMGFTGAIVQQRGLSLYKHFNHNDIYHIIQMTGMYLLFRGAVLLKDYGY